MALPTILLVDDTKLFLLLEKEMLSRSAVLILTATNGREALDIVYQHRPDLIFMDLYMPEMDGAACCAAIKADPALNSIPVVIVTTSESMADRERCSAAGCSGYLVKPFNRNEFLKIGRNFIPGIDRREKRLVWHAPVFITIKSETRTATSVDLSLNGIFISSPPRGEINDPVNVTFAIDESQSEWVEAWGRITWINQQDSPTKPRLPQGFGVQFLAMTDADRERLVQFLRSRETMISRQRL
jgi:CheY-like chemotaxis protein